MTGRWRRQRSPGRRLGVALSVLVLAVTAAGCAPVELPKDRYYRLEVGASAPAAAAPSLAGVLEVARPVADGLVAGQAILYTSGGPGAPLMESDFHFWASAPSVMLQEALVRCLDDAAAADMVVADRMRLPADYRLTGRLIRLERAIGPPAEATLALQLGIHRLRDDRLLFWRRYAATRAAADDSVAAAAPAFNDAFAAVCHDLVADLERHARTAGPGHGGSNRRALASVTW
ncbi:MAG: hypothetical protein EA406_13485 [Rhodospirillales bacterium]|nr:MAG: hypothetical protein EA406_13485 [Rhodospirillales bacterium]